MKNTAYNETPFYERTTMSNILPIVKTVTSVVVGISVSSTTGAIIRNCADEPETTYETVKLGVTCLTVGAVVARAAQDYTDATIDSIAAAFRKKNDTSDYTPVEEIL